MGGWQTERSGENVVEALWRKLISSTFHNPSLIMLTLLKHGWLRIDLNV